jgi:hypothetical protein
MSGMPDAGTRDAGAGPPKKSGGCAVAAPRAWGCDGFAPGVAAMLFVLVRVRTRARRAQRRGRWATWT